MRVLLPVLFHTTNANDCGNMPVGHNKEASREHCSLTRRLNGPTIDGWGRKAVDDQASEV